MSQEPNQKTDIKNQHLPFTLETGLYLVILALAAWVRLYRLGLAPLSASEAAQALAAWRGGAPPSGASPVLYAINSILFALMGPDDGLARLGAALFGVALVGAPFLLRHRLGRIGALGAAFVLAISPTAIMASRTLDGQVVAALAGLALLAAADHYLQTSRPTWVNVLAALLALGLMSGSNVYTLTLIFAGGLAFYALSGQRWPAIGWTGFAIILAGGVLGVSTVLLWRPVGLSAVGELLSAWLRGFASANSTVTTGRYLPLQILISYEMMALVVGLAGLLTVLIRPPAESRGNPFGVFLGYWALAATLLITLRAGRAPQDVIIIVIPLACLAGYSVELLAESLRREHAGWRASSVEIAFTAAMLIIMAFGMLALSDYAVNPYAIQPIGSPAHPVMIHRAVIQGLLAAALLGIVILLMMGIEAKIALRGSALAVIIFLAMGAWSAGWGAAQARPGDPRELLAGPKLTSSSVRLMVNTLNTISAKQAGQPYTLPLVVVAPSPDANSVLAWALRDFANVQYVSGVDDATSRSLPYVVITPFTTPPTLSSHYTGQDLALFNTWASRGTARGEALRWLLYRWSPAAPPVEERVVIWVRQEEAAQATP